MGPSASTNMTAAGAELISVTAQDNHKKGPFCCNLDSNDITVQLQYLKDDPLYDHVKPLQITPNFADREHRTNVRLTAGDPEILHNVRALDNTFTLDQNGFQYIKAPTTFQAWHSQLQIAQLYLPELESLLRQQISGSDEIIFYDARIRQHGETGTRIAGLSHNPFARQVHTDNTPRSVLEKIHALTDMKAEFLLSGRARIINIWRPIKHPVYDCGLAVADGHSLLPSDVIECLRARADNGAYWDTMGVVKFRPGFKWYYMHEQSEDDVLLFKNYDSAPGTEDIPAHHCLHTAFDVPPHLVPAGSPTRESIEVRALIFTYPEGHGRRSNPLPSQHPLALDLEQGRLVSYLDEPSLTDRVKSADLDEAGEIKDAELLLRARRIRRLEECVKGLVAERDWLRGELGKVNCKSTRVGRGGGQLGNGEHVTTCE